MKRSLLLLLTLALTLTLMLTSAPAVEAQDLKRRVESYVEAHQKEIVTDLRDLIAIPSVASDAANIRKKASRLRELFLERGFDAELLETDGNPLVWAELRTPGASRTLLLYCHYDGQPVDASKWSQPDPFVPVLRSGSLADGGQELDLAAVSRFERDWRIYARSASDDTGPIVALLAAVDALRDASVPLTSNLRVVLDGEEEAGSPSLVPAIGRYRDRFDADLMLIFDGPLHPTEKPTLVYGARGIVTLELTVYGPKFPLHSGHYGNWAPNPALRLAELLASMKDADGRVVVEGFYDGIVLTAEDEAVLASVPDDLEGLKRFLGFSETDLVGDSLQEALQYPSLNVRGLHSGWVGAEARTIIPADATAAIDIRLVAETEADEMFDKVRTHIERQGYYVAAEPPDDETRARHGRIVRLSRSAGSNAFRTPLDDPAAARVVEALAEMWGELPIRQRTMGGTVPIAPFVRELGFPALNVPTVNFDNNQHSPDENLRLGHFFSSVVSFAAIFTM